MSPADPADGEWPLRRLLGEVMGAGPKSATEMSREQAREAFARVLAGEPAPETLGAFLLANRWKGNTPTELAAFADVMREQSVEPAAPAADPVDCGANYDGKRETALLGVAAGATAAAAGTPVVVHSGDRLPTKRGCAYRHALSALGVATELSPAASAAMVDETGVGFYDQSRFNPLVDRLRESRERMGVRTAVNTVETLANPADADVHLGSFYHLSFARRVAATARESERLGFDRVVMVQGLEGYDDVRPGAAGVAEWHRDGGDDAGDEDLLTRELDPADCGTDFETDDLAVEDVAADSARLTEAVLSGERDGPVADAVALNAALRLSAGGAVGTVRDGVERARDAIADGSAAAVLADLRAFDPASATRQAAEGYSGP